jgi:predicted phosphodiesterase
MKNKEEEEKPKHIAVCGNCDKEHTVGSEIIYDNNYTVFCNNGDCSIGAKVIGSTVLEECWWDD